MQFFKLFKFYDNNCKYLCFAICYPWYRGIIAIGQGGSAIIGTKTNWFFLSLSNAWRGALHVWTQCNYQWWPWPGMVFWWAELCCGVVVLQSCNENSLKIFGDGSVTNQLRLVKQYQLSTTLKLDPISSSLTQTLKQNFVMVWLMLTLLLFYRSFADPSPSIVDSLQSPPQKPWRIFAATLMCCCCCFVCCVLKMLTGYSRNK